MFTYCDKIPNIYVVNCILGNCYKSGTGVIEDKNKSFE
jgi:hypothetical protein